MILLACRQPNDVLHGPEDVPPAESEWGYRLTSGPGSDVVRGVTPDGRIVFRTRDLIPYGSADVIASIAPTGGPAREEAGIYRQALVQPVGGLVFAAGRRVMATWSPAEPGVHGCPTEILLPGGTLVQTDVPPPGPVVGLTLFELGAEDGTAVSNLPSRALPVDAVAGAGSLIQRVRVLPAHREVSQYDVNPFGPTLLPDGSLAVSDGERVWIGTVDGSGLRMIGAGAFPAADKDGTTLAFARPVGVDSTIRVYVVPLTLGQCVQEHVDVTHTGWEVVLYDIASGAERILGPGIEPVFDALEPRLLVRDTSGFRWLGLDGTDLGGAGAPVGAFAPAVLPDGSAMAYSHPGDGNTDVFLLPIGR